MKQKIARLVPPHADKNWSFQVLHATEEDKRLVRSAVSAEVVKAAHPFLQGCADTWIMVEFWSDNGEVIDQAAKYLFDLVGLDVCKGHFTREDLGLGPS